MERIEKLISILKLTPHYQPELVKEACHRILARSIKEDAQTKARSSELLKPLTEILIQYCDNDDSAQRSLFNDYLNTVVLNFQHTDYQIIFDVFLEHITNNGSVRSVTVSLQRIQHLIQNVRPIDLGCEPQKLVKALIEISRRSDDEYILRALDSALIPIAPYLRDQINKSKEMQMLANSLIELILRNLQHESSQTKRLAASSLATLCLNSEVLAECILTKLSHLLGDISEFNDPDIISGFSLCVKLIPKLAQRNHVQIVNVVLKLLQNDIDKVTSVSSCLDLLYDILKFPIDVTLIDQLAGLVVEKFLIQVMDGKNVIKPDIKVILRVNALKILTILVLQSPSVFDRYDSILLFKDHGEIAVRNQIVANIGNYIDASWRFPRCINNTICCDKARHLWLLVRSIIIDEKTHVDTLKSCVISLKTCMATILESDHCLHIIEYQDLDYLIKLYQYTNFKPLQVELLNLFASLNFRTLNYLEKNHWSKMKSHIAGAFVDTIQDRILRDIIIDSLTHDHQRIRQAASASLLLVLPNLFISSPLANSNEIYQRSSDSIVALSQDLVDKHLHALREAQELGKINGRVNEELAIEPDFHGSRHTLNSSKIMSSSILQIPENQSKTTGIIDFSKQYTKYNHHISICINLKHIVTALKDTLFENFSRGKIAISSIVQTMYDLCVVYPISQYLYSWDCRPSEYCVCFTLLNFLLTYMENLTEPDIIVEDLEAYRIFLLFTNQLLNAVCHECILTSYETQRLKPLHQRQAATRDGDWAELTVKPARVALCLEAYFKHLTKLLCLLTSILDQRPNPFSANSKQNQSVSPTDLHSPTRMLPDEMIASHHTLSNSAQLLTRAYKKLESSYRSSKKNLNQSNERFYQILDSCLNNLSSTLEYINMRSSLSSVKDILLDLKISSQTCNVSSLKCARQLLKSLFGINIIAIFQVDPIDWFDNTWLSQSLTKPVIPPEKFDDSSRGIYHHLVTNPFKIISEYYPVSRSHITPSSDHKDLTSLSYKNRIALIVKRRIEDRVKTLFETNYLELTVKMRTISDTLKATIIEFTPIVRFCINQFGKRGGADFQAEIIHFMRYLVLLRVNFKKLDNSESLIKSVEKQSIDEPVFLDSGYSDTIEPLQKTYPQQGEPFYSWMSTVIRGIHLVITHINEEGFSSSLGTKMSVDSFANYLLHVAQICISEIIIQMSYPDSDCISLLIDQLSSYLLYLTYMFQSGDYFQLSRSAEEIVKRNEGDQGYRLLSFMKLCLRARLTEDSFSSHACDQMFFHIRLVYPHLTIMWCDVMMLLNNVDCNKEYWCDLLAYECHNCKCSLSPICGTLQSSLTLKSDSSLVHPFTGGDELPILPQQIDQKIDNLHFQCSNRINRPSSLNLSDLNFNHHLRRSFIRKIADKETKDKPLNRNIIDSNITNNGRSSELENSLGNTEQCLSPNIELCRRGALCLVLDFVTISMNDVEHITWLIIHHINDIIRWSHEPPISEFITAVHSNTGSSGIFIQAIDCSFTNLNSIHLVRRLLWTLKDVHYTQYGSLLVLLLEKLLSSEEVQPYLSLTRDIEQFACSTIQRLLNETNRGLVTTSDEVINQLSVEDLDRMYSLLDHELYPELSKSLIELRGKTELSPEKPAFLITKNDSDDDSDSDGSDMLFKKARLVYCLAEKKQTARITILIPALNSIRDHLSDVPTVKEINSDKPLACMLIACIYYLTITILPKPTRVIKPRFWSTESQQPPSKHAFPPLTDLVELSDSARPIIQPLPEDLCRKPTIKEMDSDLDLLLSRKTNLTEDQSINITIKASLRCLFLIENIQLLQNTQFEALNDIIILLCRLPLVNSFVLTPSSLWKQNLWPPLSDTERCLTNFPMVTHHVLLKDLTQIDEFCSRLLILGWINRRQFEEAWMTLLGVLSATLSNSSNDQIIDSETFGIHEKKLQLVSSCKLITSITRFLLLSNRQEIGNPLSNDIYPVQTFETRVVDITKSIASNLGSLRKITQGIFENLDKERKKDLTNLKPQITYIHGLDSYNHSGNFNKYLRVSAEKLRFNATEMQDCVVIDDPIDSKREQPDIDSCIKLLASVYKQKIRNPEESLYERPVDDNTLNKPSKDVMKSSLHQNVIQQQQQISGNRSNQRSKQIAPPLASAICQSILALSDLFTELDQFDWMFETFIEMFKSAERNEDEIQMQQLIVGLCKSVAICCYELPGEQASNNSINHKDVMFEKCRQSIEKCMKSNFGPLRLNALSGTFYMLEDSVHIVASGAYELDHFKRFRQTRLNWIHKLTPILLDNDNTRFLTTKAPTIKLLESLFHCVGSSI